MATPVILGSSKADIIAQLIRHANDFVEQVAQVPLVADDAAAGVFSWQNQTGRSIWVSVVGLNITTFTSGACTLDVGTAATAISNDTLIDGIDAATPAKHVTNISDPGTNGLNEGVLVADDEYVTASKKTGAAAGLVGIAYIKYIML